MRIIQIKKRFYRWCEETIELLKDALVQIEDSGQVLYGKPPDVIFSEDYAMMLHAEPIINYWLEYSLQWEVSKRKKNYLCRAEKRWSRLQEMSENGADVSWHDVGKVLEEEISSAEDIQADLVRNNKGNICQSIDNCMTVFQRDLLLKGAIRKNELSGKIDIVGDLGWERTSSSLTDTDVYQLHWYLEKQYGLKNERNINKAMNIAAARTGIIRFGSIWSNLYGMESIELEDCFPNIWEPRRMPIPEKLCSFLCWLRYIEYMNRDANMKLWCVWWVDRAQENLHFFGSLQSRMNGFRMI